MLFFSFIFRFCVVVHWIHISIPRAFICIHPVKVNQQATEQKLFEDNGGWFLKTMELHKNVRQQTVSYGSEAVFSISRIRLCGEAILTIKAKM